MITILQLLILTAYILYLVYEFGVLPSISESTYRFSRQERYWFTFALWAVALLNFFQPLGMFGALASAGLFFTGVTVSFKSKAAHTNIVHYVGAATAIICSFVGLVFLHGLWFVPLIALVFMIPALFSENKIWWVEIIAILFIFVSYFFI